MTEETYTNKVSSIIERVEDNHFKWVVILITSILSMSTVLSALLTNSNHLFRIISLVVTFVPFFIVQISSLYLSNKYLLMGRCFRELEKDTDKMSFDWRSKINIETKKKTFIQNVCTLMIFVSVLIFISLLTAAILI